MKQNKLPRDFMGIVFYVLGWIIGMLLKGVYHVVKFIAMALYAGFKRDRLNRRLRLALQKIESAGGAPEIRAFGREELRHIAASVGLTNSRWHKNEKVRRRISEALKTAGETAIEKGDLSQIEAPLWIDETSRILFANFERSLLTDQNLPKKRRHRFSRKSSMEKAPVNIEEHRSKAIGEMKPGQPVVTELTVPKNRASDFATSELDPIHPNLQPIANISSVSATDWADNDDDTLSAQE